MIHCPECGVELEELRREVKTFNDIQKIDKNGNIETVDHVDNYSSEDYTWHCPECWTKIADNDREAVIFLRHKTDLECAVEDVVGEKEDGT